MTAPDRLDRLLLLAEMIRDAELDRLTRASQRRAVALAALAAHDSGAARDTDTENSILIAARHDRWRALRRAELNTDLARETAAWSGTRERAARAFGRADVLGKLAGAHRKKR